MPSTRKLLFIDLPFLACAFLFAAFSDSPSVMAVFHVLVVIFAFTGAIFIHLVLSNMLDRLFIDPAIFEEDAETSFILYDPDAESIEVDSSYPGIIRLIRRFKD